MDGKRAAAADPVRAALRRLIDRGLTSDVDIDKLVPRDIQNSWRRSISSHVDPSGQPRIEDLGTREDLLHEAAKRVMDRWYSSLSDTRTTLLLGNAQGRIVWRRTIDARDRRVLNVFGVVEGSDFSESTSGTNGLGTAIEGRSPILVRGSQHFLESLRDVACAAAPVIHPLTGRIVGSVSLTVASDQANDYLVSVARQASQEISDVLLEGADSRDVALARAFRQARVGQRGVLVMNRDTVMSDLPALSKLDGEMQALIWDQLVGRLDVGEQRSFNLPHTGLAGTVRNVGHGSDPVLELRLSSTPDAAAGHDPGPAAPSASGHPPSTAAAPPRDTDEAVAGWWTAMNRVPQDRSRMVAVSVPAGSDGEEWIRVWSLASGREARGVVSDPAADEKPATGDRQTGAPAFPSLRRRRSALADLARAAYRGDGGPPRFTTEALGALLSWHWPGDLAELAELVNNLPHRSTDPWIVDVGELPAHFRTGPRRELTRWEHAERDSVLTALADAGGNKSDAAALLGIGRTTLYRKLRSLSIDQLQIDALARQIS